MDSIVLSTRDSEVTPQALPVTPQQLLRLVQVQRFGTQMLCMNTFYMGTEDGLATGGNLAADWAANIVPTWKNNVTGAMNWVDVYAQQILPTVDAVISATVSGTGAISSFTAPSATAGIITWRTE